MSAVALVAERLLTASRRVGQLGIALGLVACWLALPPLETRATVWPVLLALVHAVWAIHLRADQIVGGTAINFLALGITGYAFIDIYGSRGTPDLPGPQSIPDTNLHLGGIPGIGGFLETAVGGLNLLTWLMLGLLVVSAVVMFRTRAGLRIRSVGEHPRAAETVGISVYAV